MTTTTISARLAKGAAWLDRQWAAGAPDPGPRFKRAVDSWADMEQEYREFGGEGCALGPDGPCQDTSFIQCSACLRKGAAA